MADGCHPSRRLALGFCLGLAWWLAPTERLAAAPSHPADPSARTIPGAGLFDRGGLRQLRFEVGPEALASLRQEPRKYVPATLREGNQVYPEVGLHLKGSTGSFRSVDDKPALTLNFGRFRASQRFEGLRKIHLNNSVEDPTYLNEFVGGELFRAAGVPAPRVVHALVEWNGRPLGLYVLKEGFTEDFLGLHFRQTQGNLYDTGPGHDVDERLERDAGEGPDDQTDLKALAVAAREPDLGKRWRRLGETLDVDRFIRFMAMEILTGHRDGYCLARNNFRIYHDPGSDKLVFVPHGMDQLFGKPDAPLFPRMSGLVAQAVLATPEGRQAYRTHLTELLHEAFQTTTLHERADQLLARLRPVLPTPDARVLDQEVGAWKKRVAERRLSILQQLAVPEFKPPRFANGITLLDGWRAVDEPAGGKMDRVPSPDGRQALRIRAGPVTGASWRSKVVLESGRYRFEGAVRTAGVEPLDFGRNQGAGLRVQGTRRLPAHHLTGDQRWRTLQVEFEVGTREAEVELICELRARQGEAWFDLDSLRLVRLEPPAARP